MPDYTSEHTGEEIDSAITGAQELAAKLNNKTRSGSVVSTSDGDQFFAFDTPFSDSDGTTAANLHIALGRTVSGSTAAIPSVGITLAGFTVNRGNGVDGSQSLDYIVNNDLYDTGF